jgi:arsenite methyltransferase
MLSTAFNSALTFSSSCRRASRRRKAFVVRDPQVASPRVAGFINCMGTKLAQSSSETIREEVRRRYGATARGESSSCGDACCSATSADMLGYSCEESAIAPEAASLGLGCGNPLAIASLQPGQTVLDLGSGAGFDCFLAARAVGPSGTVIGVDMTDEMLAKARENARKNGFSNVEFRFGEIEVLPVADESVDVIISNCVINLSPEKQRVFNEAFRVLKPAGRLAVADMVATAPLPDHIKADWAAYTGCMAGASQISELEEMLQEAGFDKIKIAPKDTSRSFIREWLPGKRVEDYLVSATIEAVKPRSVVPSRLAIRAIGSRRDAKGQWRFQRLGKEGP